LHRANYVFSGRCEFLGLGREARADLQFCNKTSYVLDLALGLEQGSAAATRGWFRVDPGACKAVLQGALEAEKAYVHARALAAYGASPLPQAGHSDFCIADGNFIIAAAKACNSRSGQRLVRFSQIKPSETEQGLTAYLGEEADYDPAQARLAGVAKFVGAGSVCAYPEHAEVPFREDALWDGYPEPSNGPYGLAKRMMLVQGQAYRAQYGFNAVHLLVMNLYGPGDHFDPDRSHVVAALIRRMLEAVEGGAPELVVWGDGLATREFLYVDDAARGLVLAAERYDAPEPVNLGAAFEISIRDLAGLLAELTGYRGRLVFDGWRPSGQRRRSADVSRAKRELGCEAEVGFREGLARTIAWYRAQRMAAAR